MVSMFSLFHVPFFIFRICTRHGVPRSIHFLSLIMSLLFFVFYYSGTNNAKIAELLRQLASSYYSRSLNGLFCVRISQGLLYMGKGLLTISPIISDGFLTAPISLACLLVVLHSCLFLKSTFLG